MSSDVNYKINEAEIFSDKKTSVEDKIGNKINLISLNISTKSNFEWKRN